MKILTFWLKNLRSRFVAHLGWEMLLMRLLFSLVICLIIPWDLEPEWEQMPNPNGIAKFIPFGWMAREGVMEWLKFPVVFGLVLYTFGRFPLIALAPALFTLLGSGAVWASQREGASQHSVQLIAMILLAQVGVLAVASIRVRGVWRKLDDATARWMVHYSKFVIAATYVSSGIMKLWKSQFTWFQKGPAMAVQTIKTNWQSYYSSSDAKLNEFMVHTVPRWLADHALLSGMFFGCGLLLELFAFLALAGRRHAFVMGLLLLSMHVMILFLTSINFTSHICAVTIFLINIPGLFLTWGHKQGIDWGRNCGAGTVVAKSRTEARMRP